MSKTVKMAKMTKMSNRSNMSNMSNMPNMSKMQFSPNNSEQKKDKNTFQDTRSGMVEMWEIKNTSVYQVYPMLALKFRASSRQ